MMLLKNNFDDPIYLLSVSTDDIVKESAKASLLVVRSYEP